MAKIKLTKNELKKQKEDLKRFTRYLPTLILKKQQLVVEIKRIEETVLRLENEIADIENKLESWVAVFAEEVAISHLIRLKSIRTGSGNIAGIDIPIYEGAEFDEEPYDLMHYPLWVDTAVFIIKKIIELKAQIRVAREQQNILREELRVTVQRINLFEKVMIPEAKEHIRVIRIYLGDLQTAEVVRGKIAKAKLDRKKEAIAV